VIDSDIIVTGNLHELVASAGFGKIVAYADPESDRWYSEWEQIFQLREPLRHEVYVCSGIVVFSQQHHPNLLDEWLAACKQWLRASALGVTDPVAQTDQDALNAVLMSMYPKEAVQLRPASEAPQARELRLGVDVVDPRALRCSYNGQPTLLLHSAGGPKPWIRLGARRNAYTTLLTRLLVAQDLPIRVPSAAIPRWLRDGSGSAAYLSALHTYSSIRRSISRRLQFVPPNIRATFTRLLP
jgi:lipopolysaccharide biosynthesis glycosyltransferase